VQATNCPVPPGLLGYDPEKCQDWGTSYEPEKAKQLLKEAGYGLDHPLDVGAIVSPLQGWDESFVVMQQQLAAVGIRAEDRDAPIRDMGGLHVEEKPRNPRVSQQSG